MRMALFQRVAESRLHTEPLSLTSLVVVDGFANLLLGFITVGPAGHLAVDRLTAMMFPTGLGFVVSSLLAGLTGKPQKLALTMVILLAVGIPVHVLGGAIERGLQTADFVDGEFPMPAIAAVWVALATAKAVLNLLDVRGWRRIVVCANLLLFFALPLAAIPPAGSLWAANEDDYDKKYDALTGEEAFYLQPKLLDQALAGLARQHPGKTELFFLGFAGDAGQDVFLSEVLAVEEIMVERFGAAGHAISLINNYRTAETYPVASVTGLRRALLAVGNAMDKDNDILFLFVTSHGHSDFSIAVDFWPLRFATLNPKVLRQALDETGIKWRVVVVSACFSGGFIEPLRSDSSIVITASAADKSSFGCDDLNDWTYFGKAFFDEALRKDQDLAQAFAAARQSIARREAEENVDAASDPQMFAGPAMNSKWRSFIQQIRPSK